MVDIEWNQGKRRLNLREHGVSFEEAASSLLDPDALALEDFGSQGESRWILVGMSNRAQLVTAVYTLRGEDCIRLKSARKSSRKEGRYYAQRV